MLNWIRKLLTTYAETEKQLLQLRCVVPINALTNMEAFIKTFSKKQRINVMKHASTLAILGFKFDKIKTKIQIEPLKYNCKKEEFEKQLVNLRLELLGVIKG